VTGARELSTNPSNSSLGKGERADFGDPKSVVEQFEASLHGLLKQPQARIEAK